MSKARRRQLTDENPSCAEVLKRDPTSWNDLVAANSRAIEQTYSIGPRGRALIELYRTIDTAPRDAPIESLEAGERILHRFLDPKRLRPIRFDP